VTRTISIKLPEPLATRLRAAVRKRGRTQSDLVREVLEAHLTGGAAGVGSCLDLARDLAGSVSGPVDLSSDPRHLRGYGRS
jgi:hypothetical protein